MSSVGTIPVTSVEAPVCPDCGGPTVRRTARRGEFAGRDFYGCAAYATRLCRGKIDIGAVARAGEPPSAGALPQAIFEQRRERELARRRALLPAVVGIAVIVMTAEYLTIWSVNPVIATVVILVTATAFLRLLSALPDDVLSWERGSKGEQSTAKHLQGLAGAGFISFANRWVSGLKGDVDAIVVGPSGVYVIETKASRAKVEVIRDRIFTGDHEQDWVDQVTREAMAVQIGLRDLLDPLHRTVVPVLCVHGKGPGIGGTVAGVRVLSGAQLVATLSAAPPVLADADVERLAEAIDTRFGRYRR